MNGIYPRHLGPNTNILRENELLAHRKLFSEIINQFPACYMVVLSNIVIGDYQVQEIICLLKDRGLYTGSIRSFKGECGVHTFGFTSSKINR